ncbi:hypothetical protein Zmor_023503 [Zophobas morio]|uniref:Uncharacterized protein n=1 Tax=Zophobas morio TaxID=2755281 RepID=A0AA38HXF7_9CUCU|nr:hypothetical protein Zmor_023503 [Zophobas morio]
MHKFKLWRQTCTCQQALIPNFRRQVEAAPRAHTSPASPPGDPCFRRESNPGAPSPEPRLLLTEGSIPGGVKVSA